MAKIAIEESVISLLLKVATLYLALPSCRGSISGDHRVKLLRIVKTLKVQLVD